MTLSSRTRTQPTFGLGEVKGARRASSSARSMKCSWVSLLNRSSGGSGTTAGASQGEDYAKLTPRWAATRIRLVTPSPIRTLSRPALAHEMRVTVGSGVSPDQPRSSCRGSGLSPPVGSLTLPRRGSSHSVRAPRAAEPSEYMTPLTPWCALPQRVVARERSSGCSGQPLQRRPSRPSRRRRTTRTR